MIKWLRFWLIALLIVTVSSVLAQDDSHQLTVGQTSSGVIDTDHLAQVYSFTSDPFTAYLLAVTNTGDLQLVAGVTDATGAPVVPARQVMTGHKSYFYLLPLREARTYYVTVIAAPHLIETQGAFTVTVDTDAINAVPPSPAVYLADGFTVTLAWSKLVQLSLEVRDPIGRSLNLHTYSIPPVAGIDLPNQIDCAQTTSTISAFEPPVTQTARWEPGEIWTGSYEILVHYLDGCVSDTSIPFTVTITVKGVELPLISSELPTTDTFISGFVLATDGSAELTGRRAVLPAQPTLSTPLTTADLIAAALPIHDTEPVEGWIGNDQPYQTYMFDGRAGANITVTLNRTLGGLDPLLALLDTNGNILGINDDRADGETDSTLSVRLPRTGTYLILATRYGEFAGATEGNFELTLIGAGS